MKKLFQFMLMAVIVAAFNACSSDDEPEVSAADVKAQYENVVSVLYDADSKLPRFTPTLTEGIYVASAEDSSVSHRFIEKVIGESWDGQTTDFFLGEYGSLRLIGGNADMEAEGIYNEIIVNIKGYTPFTLRIIDTERANEDNGYTGTGVVPAA